MNYKAINELEHFQFHDAEIKKIQIINDQMIWEVSGINAMTSNTQNQFPKDMCTEDAIMEFENTCISSLVFCAYTVYDSKNNSTKSIEPRTANPDEYNDTFSKSTKSSCFILEMSNFSLMDDKKYQICFLIDGNAAMFYLTFTFSKSIISWDEYYGEAWYEQPKWQE